jgi:hypothetical protein
MSSFLCLDSEERKQNFFLTTKKISGVKKWATPPFLFLLVHQHFCNRQRKKVRMIATINIHGYFIFSLVEGL